jgi:hypothetical protein
MSACSPVARIANNTNAIRTEARALIDHGQDVGDQVVVDGATRIDGHAADIHGDLARVEDRTPAWLSTLQWWGSRSPSPASRSCCGSLASVPRSASPSAGCLARRSPRRNSPPICSTRTHRKVIVSTSHSCVRRTREFDASIQARRQSAQERHHMSAFIGSIWFAGLTFLAGYILGQVFPISSLPKLLGKK